MRVCFAGKTRTRAPPGVQISRRRRRNGRHGDDRGGSGDDRAAAAAAAAGAAADGRVRIVFTVRTDPREPLSRRALGCAFSTTSNYAVQHPDLTATRV